MNRMMRLNGIDSIGKSKKEDETMAFRIVLIGCGNLGSRHLQAIKKTQKEIVITVCEPIEAARKIALERYAQIEENSLVQEFEIIEDYHQLKPDYDLAIIATNAVNRYEISAWVVENLKIRYLILEKVVFQTLKEFELLQQKLGNKQIKAWVNCPRRMYPYYRELQPQLSGEKNIDMVVTGGSWGMGSNTIHLLDLYSYLTHFKEYQYDISGLEEQIADSKRSGYKEFYGELQFVTEKGKLSVYCSHGNEPAEFRLTTSQGEMVINESEEIVCYQSNLTNLAVEQLIDCGECNLASYEESAFLHKAMLESFLEHMNRFSKEEVRRCPIT